MPENPLLPDAELRALLALTMRCTKLEAALGKIVIPRRGQRSGASGREAALAATAMQMRPGDLWLPEPADRLALTLASKPDKAKLPAVDSLPGEYTKGQSRLLLAATMAAALRIARTDPQAEYSVALTLQRAGTADPSWPAALAWAQERLLPLLVVCFDASGPAAFTAEARTAPSRFVWTAVARAAARLQLPILTVDGEDAVAMYRTAQEALLRARTGGGPALLWAALPTPAQRAARPKTQRPLARLTRYLRTRGIALT